MDRYSGAPVLLQGQIAISQPPKTRKISCGASIQEDSTVRARGKEPALGSEVADKDCSQLLPPSVFAEDPSPCTLTGDSVENEEKGGRGTLFRDGKDGAGEFFGLPFKGHFGARWYSLSHLRQRLRIPAANHHLGSDHPPLTLLVFFFASPPPLFFPALLFFATRRATNASRLGSSADDTST